MKITFFSGEFSIACRQYMNTNCKGNNVFFKFLFFECVMILLTLLIVTIMLVVRKLLGFGIHSSYTFQPYSACQANVKYKYVPLRYNIDRFYSYSSMFSHFFSLIFPFFRPFNTFQVLQCTYVWHYKDLSQFSKFDHWRANRKIFNVWTFCQWNQPEKGRWFY